MEVGVFLKWKLSQAANKQLLVQQQMQQQQQKQLEVELRQGRGAGGGGSGGGSSADSIREVVNAAISLEFQRQRDRDYNSRQVGYPNHAVVYKDRLKGLCVVARNVFLLLLNCYAWPCLALPGSCLTISAKIKSHLCISV